MIIKKYSVSFIYGIINPVEKSIEIESANELTEDFIKEEIIRKYPNYENQIQGILSTLLIGEKELLELKEDSSNVDFEEKDKNDNMSFNW